MERSILSLVLQQDIQQDEFSTESDSGGSEEIIGDTVANICGK